MIIHGTHRAYLGADTFIAAFVRDDKGGKDLEGAEVSATVYAGPGKDLLTLSGAGNEFGRVSFLLTGEQAVQSLRPGVFDMRVVADGETVYTASLEVVG